MSNYYNEYRNHYDNIKEEETVPTKPKHYDKKLDPIGFMELNFTPEQYMGFLKGNIIKYVSRFEEKGGLEDINKAEEYLRLARAAYASS